MPLFQDPSVFQKRLAGLPVMECRAGADVLTAGSKTGKLFFLKSGAVEVIKDGVQIANVSTPGAVFGELSALLDQPHTAGVRTVEESEFFVADAPTLFAIDSAVALYVAAILAHRLDGANRALLDVKRQLTAGESRKAITRNVEKVEELLAFPMDASLIYAGYPYDPFAARPTA
jgi:CRP-like cAMP-binding protein